MTIAADIAMFVIANMKKEKLIGFGRIAVTRLDFRFDENISPENAMWEVYQCCDSLADREVPVWYMCCLTNFQPFVC